MKKFNEGSGGRKAWQWVDTQPSRWSDEAGPEVIQPPSCRGAPPLTAAPCPSPTGGSLRASVGTSLAGEAEHGSQHIPCHH